MNEDHNVSEIGEMWGRMAHRKLSVARCENGYVVKYTVPAKKPVDPEAYHQPLVEKQKVFITNTDLLEFVEKYFSGEPMP